MGFLVSGPSGRTRFRARTMCRSHPFLAEPPCPAVSHESRPARRARVPPPEAHARPNDWKRGCSHLADELPSKDRGGGPPAQKSSSNRRS